MSQKQYAVLMVRKIKNQGTLNLAMQHNTRLILQEHFDIKREHLNYYSRPLEAVMELYEQKRPPVVRSNGIHVVEFVVSGSEDKLLKVDYAAYFKDSAVWLASKLGGEQNRLGVYIHRDEDVPHMHVLVMPLVDGKLCYSRFLGGNKYQLQKFQTDFANEIAKAYGLERGIMNSGTKKQSFHTYNRIVHAAIPELPSMDIPKAAFGILTDPKSFGESVLAQYQELMKPEWIMLTQQARLAMFQDTEIQTLKKANSERMETITLKAKELKRLKDLVLEGGQALEAYRLELENEKTRTTAKSKKRDRSDDRGR